MHNLVYRNMAFHHLQQIYRYQAFKGFFVAYIANELQGVTVLKDGVKFINVAKCSWKAKMIKIYSCLTV